MTSFMLILFYQCVLVTGVKKLAVYSQYCIEYWQSEKLGVLLTGWNVSFRGLDCFSLWCEDKICPLYLWRKVPVMLPSSSVREGKMGALFIQVRSPLQMSSKSQGLHSLGLTEHGTALFSLGDASESSRTATGIVTIYLACTRLCIKNFICIIIFNPHNSSI